MVKINQTSLGQNVDVARSGGFDRSSSQFVQSQYGALPFNPDSLPVDPSSHPDSAYQRMMKKMESTHPADVRILGDVLQNLISDYENAENLGQTAFMEKASRALATSLKDNFQKSSRDVTGAALVEVIGGLKYKNEFITDEKLIEILAFRANPGSREQENLEEAKQLFNKYVGAPRERVEPQVNITIGSRAMNFVNSDDLVAAYLKQAAKESLSPNQKAEEILFRALDANPGIFRNPESRKSFFEKDGRSGLERENLSVGSKKLLEVMLKAKPEDDIHDFLGRSVASIIRDPALAEPDKINLRFSALDLFSRMNETAKVSFLHGFVNQGLSSGEQKPIEQIQKDALSYTSQFKDSIKTNSPREFSRETTELEQIHNSFYKDASQSGKAGYAIQSFLMMPEYQEKPSQLLNNLAGAQNPPVAVADYIAAAPESVRPIMQAAARDDLKRVYAETVIWAVNQRQPDFFQAVIGIIDQPISQEILQSKNIKLRDGSVVVDQNGIIDVRKFLSEIEGLKPEDQNLLIK